MEKQKHSDNVYAYLNDLKTVIHISTVTRKTTGRGPGYFCVGCQRRLQAVLSIEDNRMSFFRHDAEAVKGQPKCTYSDETYRHKLGKEILQRLKSIRVPNLYKYSPDKDHPRKFLLVESQYVTAHKVLIEHYIYETEKGEIAYSLNEKIVKGKELFIKPDVLFLDKNEKPILIIELVATHKPDKNKLVKLKRLGINAVQVRVPRDSPEAIELAFKRTENTHWIYNHVEESTEYIPVPGSSIEGISSIDVEQKRFFEETFACRSSQIGNLVRQIEHLLESELYRQIVRDFESEIYRIENNTRSSEQRLGELRKRFGEQGVELYRARREELMENQNEFQDYVRGLETRYSNKKHELDRKGTTIDEAIATAEYQLSATNSRTTADGHSIEKESRTIEHLAERIEEVRRSQIQEQGECDQARRNIKQKTQEVEAAIREFTITSKAEGERLEKDFAKRTEQIRQQVEETNIDEEGIRRSLANKYPTDRDDYINRVATGNYQRGRWFTEEIELFGKLIETIKAYTASYERYERIKNADGS